MDGLNVVCLTGHLARDPSVHFDQDSGHMKASGTLCVEEIGSNGTAFKLYVSLESWGRTAEALGQCQEGTQVAIQGKLVWRKHRTRDGVDKSGLAVMAGKISVLATDAVDV